MEAISVLLIHPYRMLAEAFAESFEPCPTVDFRWANGTTSSEPPDREPADVVLVDIRACDEPAHSIRAMKQAHPRSKILPFGLSSTVQTVDLLAAGACSYVELDASFDELQDAIHQVHRHRAVTASGVVTEALQRLRELSRDGREGHREVPEPAEPVELTPKEEEVLELICEGCSNSQIARCLGISVSTVKMHVHRVLAKLQAKGRRDAVRVAVERGLLSIPAEAVGLIPSIVGRGSDKK